MTSYSPVCSMPSCCWQAPPLLQSSSESEISAAGATDDNDESADGSGDDGGKLNKQHVRFLFLCHKLFLCVYAQLLSSMTLRFKRRLAQAW